MQWVRAVLALDQADEEMGDIEVAGDMFLGAEHIRVLHRWDKVCHLCSIIFHDG
jgi:hypothetical protein